MRFNPEEYRKAARDHFEQAWHKGPLVVTPPGREQEYPRLQYRKALPHPIFEMVSRLRETYLLLGFEEACNPIIVDEQEVPPVWPEACSARPHFAWEDSSGQTKV